MNTTEKKKTAGTRDLSAAVAQVHCGPNELPDVPAHLLLAPGDLPGRDSFYDHDDSRATLSIQDNQVHVVFEPKVVLPDYRSLDMKRIHRTMITVPPKLRESIRECFGVEQDSDYPLTTAIIALADYAAMVLKRDGKCLFVNAALDPYAAERRDARKTVRDLNAGPKKPRKKPRKRRKAAKAKKKSAGFKSAGTRLTALYVKADQALHAPSNPTPGP